MIKLTCLNLELLLWMLCCAHGQFFEIQTKFFNGKLIFTWSNTSTIRNDIRITKDSQTSPWIVVFDDQYTVEDVLLYKSVSINVREYYNENFNKGQEDYEKTYYVFAVESMVGESKNVSWTVEYFPRSGIYFIFHEYNGTVSTVIGIENADPLPTEKYVYHTRPFNSVNILLEVRNITVEDAGYYVGGSTEADAWRGGGVVLIVSGMPEKPIITGTLNVKVGDYAFLKCESRSTSAPYYYKKFPPLSYSWFVNNTRLDREIRETYNFTVTKDVKYNRYSCQAKETLESEKSEETQINPLYGPDTILVTPGPPIDGLSIHDGGTFGPYTCSADCNTPCTVQWKYKHPDGGLRDATSNGTTTVTVPVQTANRSSMALIQCVLSGIEGKILSPIKFNIQYLSNPKIYINGNLQKSRTVDEGSPLLLVCNVEGNPMPEIILRKLTGNKILGQHRSTWFNHTMIREAQCSDTSTYSCEGSSSEFDSKYQSVNINVLCDPRLDMSTLVKTNYGSMSGPDVIVPVTVPVIANPAISPSGITWSGPSATSILTSIDTQGDTFIYKQMIKSSIPIPDQRAFGNYSLMYRGKTIVDIIIKSEDKPQPPLKFTGHSYASGYVNLTWISNFNGGLDQVFTLYRKEGSNWRVIKNLTDPGEGEVGFFDPGLLNTGQEYWFRLESCNRISCSSRPAEFKVTVRDVCAVSREASTRTAWVVVGVFIGLSILLLTHFGVYKFAFYRGDGFRESGIRRLFINTKRFE
ncbi:uncharacterized protein LOC134235849 isoform X2 [Saccostrea cucullata]|uniref:uncharacterized protein LOC134235849 isoform X2 n=1 Tax=Saccostrea cuccullata TaxID=36930 RepID=UPI002ECFB611